MWILQSEPGGTAHPFTFRMGPEGARTLGRAVRADFVVDVAMVSRLHCRFVSRERGELEVEDLNSTNGTFVNGRRVQRATLEAGDRLRVGRLELVVSRE
jgi:pSer/pThr/pTyr-binding forkhead associated (FHA) protein